MRILAFICAMIFATALQAQNAPIKRNVLTTPPPETSKAGYKVIKRVYRVSADQNSTEEAKKAPKYNFFAGVGASYIMRERSVVIDTKNTGDTLRLDNRLVVADGSTYSTTSDEREFVPELEIGMASTADIFYGAKVTLYKEFVEAAIFTGIRFDKVNLGGFVPVVQVLGGIGYSDTDQLTPDNLTIGVFGGIEKALKDDFLTLNVSASYQHRYWQQLNTSYGKEYWRDNEIGIRASLRYAF